MGTNGLKQLKVKKLVTFHEGSKNFLLQFELRLRKNRVTLHHQNRTNVLTKQIMNFIVTTFKISFDLSYIYNPSYNILRLFDVLPNFALTTSETKRDQQ